eukprot:192657-Rhodomonas_salina.4
MIRGINLESFPFIVDLSTMKSFIWDNGVTAEWISRSPAISVSSRGVRFIHPSFHVIHDDDYILCDRTRGALCESASGFRVFPYDTARVGFLGGSGCDEVFSGRTGSYLYVRDGFLGDIEYGFISAVGVFIIAYSVHRATTSEGSGAFLSSIVMIFSRVMLDTFRGDIIRTLDLYLDTVFAGIITTYGFIPQYTAVEKAVLHLMLIVSVLFSFGGYFYKKPEAVNDKV